MNKPPESLVDIIKILNGSKAQERVMKEGPSSITISAEIKTSIVRYLTDLAIEINSYKS